MLGSSGESLGRLTAELGAALDGGADGSAVGTGLFGAADVLRAQPALRRAATDPTASAEARSSLAVDVFGAHLDKAAVALVGQAVALRWASSGDLPEALEQLAIVALVKAADRNGEGDRLEAELFGFSRTLAEHHDLRDALVDPARSVADKQSLVSSLLDGKVTSGALQLSLRAVSGVRRTATGALEDYVKLAAAARDRAVATVRVARPLSAEAHRQLADGLSRQQGQPVHLNVVVDPSVLGGVHVELGDQVIDGTIASRLDDARRRLVG